jgi:hypothetical protein
MARMVPLVGLLKNLKQEIPKSRRREYLTKDQAYERLKMLTGKDYSHQVEQWEVYLSSIEFDLKNVERS